MMKKLKFILLTFITVVSFTACETDDDLEFVANEAEGIEFNTSFLENYVLNSSVPNNLAERFTWNNADFGVPTNITYYLQGATTADFSDYMPDMAGEPPLYDLGSTTANPQANEIPVTVGQMLSLAEVAGLDNDPDSAEPNTGMIYFRLMAVIGNDGLPSYSNIKGLNVELQEQTTGGSEIMPASWGVVGSGYNNWGAFEDATFYTTSESGVIVSYVNLLDGEIKFRENNTWGGDLGDANNDGILDADPDNNIAVTAGDYKITIDTNDNSYTIEPFSWGIVGSGYNDWGATPDAKLSYDYTTDTFKVGVRLIDGEIKFRMNNTWGGDLGDSDLDGFLDANSDNNIAVTEGHYVVTVNLSDNSYTIETSNIWGIVGSGYNDWGATPDFNLTEVNPNIWIAENVTLLDGEIKFRQNNTWGGDLGDAGSDGILDSDPDNNIAVTAGNYVVRIDFTDPGAPAYSLGARQ